MKKGTGTIWTQDPNAIRWEKLSLLGFWVSYPDVYLSGDPVSPPERLAQVMDRFMRYGVELRVLETDLVGCMNEFQLAHDTLYHDPMYLLLKKFPIVYHVDNFYVRIHKSVENIYRLLALLVRLDPTRRPTREMPSLREQVKTGLDRRRHTLISENLRALEDNKWIKRAVEARNLFVHQYREEPEWPMLHPCNRFWEPDDPLARDVHRIEQGTDLDRLAARKALEMSKTVVAIRRFRDRLFTILRGALSDLKKR